MKKNKGFTLIELMIVVAIVGILAAVAIPKFAEIYNKAKNKANGVNYSYVAVQYSNDGKELDEYKVASYWTENGGAAHLTLEDGSKVVITGTYKIKEVNSKRD